MGLDIVYYSKDNKYLGDFRAGSCSFYNRFRNFLYDLSLNLPKKKLFSILFFHSDCEGDLIFRECQKLLKDFENPKLNQFLLLESLDEENYYLIESFKDWKKALKIVVKNRGFMIFC